MILVCWIIFFMFERRFWIVLCWFWSFFRVFFLVLFCNECCFLLVIWLNFVWIFFLCFWIWLVCLCNFFICWCSWFEEWCWKLLWRFLNWFLVLVFDVVVFDMFFLVSDWFVFVILLWILLRVLWVFCIFFWFVDWFVCLINLFVVWRIFFCFLWSCFNCCLIVFCFFFVWVFLRVVWSFCNCWLRLFWCWDNFFNLFRIWWIFCVFCFFFDVDVCDFCW